METKHFNSRQIAGYRANLVGAIRQCQDGAEVVIDLTTAERIVKILDQMIRQERNHEGMPPPPPPAAPSRPLDGGRMKVVK